MDTIRWGILGTGKIAGKFAQGLAVLPDAELVAVGSRAQETADAFGVPRRYGRSTQIGLDQAHLPHAGATLCG